MTTCTGTNVPTNPPANDNNISNNENNNNDNNNTITNDVPSKFSNDCDILKGIFTSLNLSATWKNESMKCCNDDTIICSTVDDVLRITKM